MNITINDQRIEYELEQEKDLGDVIKSLERLARSTGSVIESISLDERSVPLDEGSPEFRELVDVGLDGVGELRVRTLPRPTLAIRSVGTLSDHCDAILGKCGELAREGADIPAASDELLEGASLLGEGLRSTLGFLRVGAMMVSAGGVRLAESLDRLDGFVALYGRRYVDPPGVESLKEIVTSLQGFLPKVLKWAVVKGRVPGGLLAPSISEILDDVRDQARKSLPLLEGVCRDLHVGEDRRALENITALIELLDEIVSLLRTPGVFADEAAALFQRTRVDLKEVEEALVNGDMVSLADSVEYTMKPVFERLVEVLKKVHFSVDTRAI